MPEFTKWYYRCLNRFTTQVVFTKYCQPRRSLWTRSNYNSVTNTKIQRKANCCSMYTLVQRFKRSI